MDNANVMMKFVVPYNVQKTAQPALVILVLLVSNLLLYKTIRVVIAIQATTTIHT